MKNMKEIKLKAKYIHILPQNETKFCQKLVELINNLQGITKKEDHLFITPHEKVYNCINEISNTVLDKSKGHLVNKYSQSCKWIFFHGHLNGLYGLKIRRKYLSKVILRFWGGNIGFEGKDGEPLKNIVKRAIDFFFIRKLSRFAAIAIANKVDTMTLRKKLKNIPIYEMPYGLGKKEEIIEITRDSKEENNTINVLVGHNGWPHDTHIQVLEKLSKFGDRICIYVPLSYGNQEYINEVESYIKSICTNNVVIVKDFMPYDEYVRFLNKIDIAVLNGEKSYALGNVAILSLLKKKIYLNRKGIIKEVFDEDNIPCGCVDEIDTMGFDEFIKKAEYPENTNNSVFPYDKKRAKGAWVKIFKDFN